MKENQAKKKLSKFVITESIICLLVVAITIAMIADFARPIVISEVSEAGLKSLVGAGEEANGKISKVTAKYVDIEGNELSSSDVLEGKVGDEYRFEGKKISGYKLVGDEPYAKSGNFQDRDTEVEFIYKESNENVDIAEGEDNDVIVRMKSQKLVSEYNLKIITKDETGNLVKGVAYEVSKNGDEMRTGVVQGETFVAGIVTINQEGTDTCTITENPGDYYETLIPGDIEFTINKIWDSVNGKYDVSVSYDKTIKGLEIKIVDDEIIVTIINKARIIEEDGGGLFDLSITKYISKVVIDNGKGVKEIDRTLEDKDNLLKLEFDAKELNKTTLTLTYNLLVKNIGDIPGYATEITDYLPEDFTLLDDEGWMEAPEAAITNELANKLLNPGEETEISVTFEWKLNENNTGLRKNQAQITMYSNDENLDDITPDNIDDAKIIVTIKTGIGRTVGFGTLAVLLVLAGVIYKERESLKNEG